jgi:hypothetical protein
MTAEPREHPFTTPARAASNIRELVEYLLRSERVGEHMYRGQSSHSDPLLPSQYRRAATGCHPQQSGIIQLDSKKYHASLDERGRRKFEATAAMLRAHGPAVGTIIAQQYGLSSECIDLTSNLHIAAFFATHEYPSYRVIKSATHAGVIYRFHVRGKLVTSVEDLDSTLTSMGGVYKSPPPIWWTAARKSADLGEQLTQDALKALGEVNRKVLFSHPLTVSYDTLHEALCVQLERFFGRPVDIARTRIARQHGGFVRPAVHWRRAIADQVKVVKPIPGKRFAMPPIAVKEDLIGVDNSLLFPGLEIFYFKHSSEIVGQITREELWPSADEDEFFALMYSRIDLANHDYLEQRGSSCR